MRSFSPGKSFVPLAPGPGQPVDLLLSAKSASTQFREATFFVNAGDGTFP